MSRRGQRSRYDDDADGWDRPSGRRVNGDYSSSGVLSASSMTRELDELMRIIETDWNQFTTVNVYTLTKTELMYIQYTPVETAMQLMDRSSLGRDYNAFKSLYSRIEKALQFVVNGT